MIQTGLLHGMIEWTDKKRPMRALGFYIHYIAYFFLVFLSPTIYGRSIFHSFACGLIHIVTAGWLFAVFSQINHLNEFSIESDRGGTSEKLLKSSWAARQVATSNNFATKSRFWHVFSNGLNMQIEHHLFPGLNHCHLHIIQPVVENTCQEYGVHYKSFDTWSDVFNATLSWLDQLSSAE
jgi:fatty acid desaturase